MIPSKTEVFVAGGGPAGLAVAIAARSKGFRVTVADCARPPIEKACGEGLMPDSLAALRRLGVHPGPAGGFVFTGIRFLGEGRSVEASFPNGAGLGIRRARLHELLLERARQLDIELLWGARVTGIDSQYVRLDGRSICYDWLIGADGQNSMVRRWAGLDRTRRQSFRYGFRRHYRVQPWSDRMEIYWGPRCQMYVTPVSAQDICVVVLAENQPQRFDAALPDFPELQRRLSGAPITSLERGAITASRQLRRVYRGRTILAGDASGSVDAITGEGLCLSFQHALLLADALESGDLDRYAAGHQRLARRPAFMADLMLRMGRSAWLRRRVLPVLAGNPAIFGRLLAMHVGEVRAILPFGRRIWSAS